MGLTVSAGDVIAPLVTGPGTFTADQVGLISGLIRGVTDPDITALVLRDSAGTIAYVYPTTGGAAITVSTTKP